MACNVGSFSTGTGAASTTVAVTGVGFEPTFVLFWWSGRTDTTDAAGSANHRFGYGAMSATERMCVVSQSVNGGASASSDAGQRFDACVASMSTAGAFDGMLDFQSFDADGFTLVVDDAMPNSMRVHYMAFDSITDVDLGFFVEPATATTQDINIGWTPSGDDTAVFFMHHANNTADPPTSSTDSRRSLGVCAGATPTNYCWGGGSDDGAATMQSLSYCRGGECVVGFEGGATVSNQRAAVTAWITNGFRLTWNEVTGNNVRRVFYAALRGGKWFAGDFLSQTNTTEFSETGVGFQPIGGFFVSQCVAENAEDTPTDDDQGSLGAVDTALNQRSMSLIDEDNTANAEVATAVEHDEFYTRLDTAMTKVGGCAINSWDADGFTAQMTDADPDQAFIWYLLHGETPAAGGAFGPRRTLMGVGR